MKLLPHLCVAALVVYSSAFIVIELATSQDYVRQFFTDIEGDVPFYAVNTTLSVFLLAAAALFLLFAATADREASPRERWFLLSQSFIFGLLAFDDRFQAHEKISYRLGVGDHYVMLVWVVAELVFLATLFRMEFANARMVKAFVAGTLLFGLMMIFDVLVPHEMVLRLSLEDLAKTWAAAMYFAFAWEAARRRTEARPVAPIAVPG